MAGELAAADVLARAETVRPGDRAIVVTYSTGRRSSFRIADVLLATDDVLASLAPLRKGDRLRLRRHGPDRPAAPRRPTAA